MEQSIQIREKELLNKLNLAQTRMNLRERLQLIAESFAYLASLKEQETIAQTRALIFIMKNRALRKKNG